MPFGKKEETAEYRIGTEQGCGKNREAVSV